MRYKLSLTSILLVAILSARAGWGAASGPVIRVSADRKQILIGERLRYKMEVETDAATEIEFPKFPEGRIGEFEIKDSGLKIKKGLFNRKIAAQWFEITAYSVGKFEITPLEVRYREKGKRDWQAKKTGTVSVTVASVLPKDSQPQDIRDVKGPLYFFEINYVLVFGILIAVILAVLGIRLYIKRRNRPVVRLPHETALEELEEIRGILARTGDVKGYYVRMSDCVRSYIERVFQVKAPEMTTEEFLVSLKESSALSIEQKGLLKEFLNACDLVKFAKYAPAQAEIEAIYVAAKKFIQETIPTDLRGHV